MSVSRNTVRKYLESSEPERNEKVAREAPVKARAESAIALIFNEWKGRTTEKQYVTAPRLQRELREREITAGVTVIKEILRERRRLEKETFVPLIHHAGDEGQVDFFEVTVDIAGERRKAWKFLIRLMYSGLDFAWLYEHADQISFLDGHVRAAAHFGGLPQRLVYDNLSSAVRKILRMGRELTERFLALSSHYLFEPCFARRGEGHDKGGVESRGKAIRLEHLTPIPAGGTLDEISEALMREIEATSKTKKRSGEEKTVAALFDEEKGNLLPLPGVPFEARMRESARVSRMALVKAAAATYSVPSHWKCLDATTLVGVTEVTILCRGEEVVLPRVGRGKRCVKYRHYLDELARKPQALRQVAAELLMELGADFGRAWRLWVDRHGPMDAARMMAKVLSWITTHGEEKVREELRRSLDHGRATLMEIGEQFVAKKEDVVAVPESLRGYEIEKGSLEEFDLLMEEKHE
jgi:transposase